jgi:hypothetical protein
MSAHAACLAQLRRRSHQSTVGHLQPSEYPLIQLIARIALKSGGGCFGLRQHVRDTCPCRRALSIAALLEHMHPAADDVQSPPTVPCATGAGKHHGRILRTYVHATSPHLRHPVVHSRRHPGKLIAHPAGRRSFDGRIYLWIIENETTSLLTDYSNTNARCRKHDSPEADGPGAEAATGAQPLIWSGAQSPPRC